MSENTNTTIEAEVINDETAKKNTNINWKKVGIWSGIAIGAIAAVGTVVYLCVNHGKKAAEAADAVVDTAADATEEAAELI